MKVMAIVKASPESEAGQMPDTELMAAMTRFNEQLADAGVLLAGEGLHPSSRGVRVQFDGAKRHVVDGPFAETKELLAGFNLIEAESLDEAVRIAHEFPWARFGSLEVRPVRDMGAVRRRVGAAEA